MITITLPLPDHKISPNGSRGRTRQAMLCKARRVKAHRQRAALITREALGIHFHKQGMPVPSFAGYSLAFYFATAARRDDDNADASCKAYRDGIGDALGMDDHRLPKLKLSTIQKDAANPRLEITLYLSPIELP